MSAGSKLLKRRLVYRLKTTGKLLRLVIDFWVALYIIVPYLAFLVFSYIGWLRALPAWFAPAYLPVLPVALTVVVVYGTPRTYLAKADTIIIYRFRTVFRTVLNYGMAAGIVLSSVTSIIVLVLIYPFYHHIAQVSLTTWAWVGIWTLIARISILSINYRLFIHLPKWLTRIVKGIIAGWFVLSWTWTVNSFIGGGGPWLPVSSALLWAALAGAATMLLPLGKWDTIVADEEYRDLNMMKLFLGSAGQTGREGTKSGRAWLARGRLGVPFTRDQTLAYLFLKYFLHGKALPKQYFLFLFIGLLFAVTPGPLPVKVALMLGVLIAVGAWLDAVWHKESNEPFVKTLPLPRRESRKGIAAVFRIMLLPGAVLFVLVPLMGHSSWAGGIGGLVFLLVVSLSVASYFSSKGSLLFNYGTGRSE